MALPSVWVPNRVADAIIHEAQGRHEAARVLEFAKRLKALDLRLDCLLQTRDVPDEGLRAGFYYVIRRNEDGTVAMWEIRNPDGSFREPADDVIEALRKGDANRTNLKAERERERRRVELGREKHKRDVLDRRHGEFKEQVEYAFRVQMPVRRKWEDAA